MSPSIIREYLMSDIPAWIISEIEPQEKQDRPALQLPLPAPAYQEEEEKTEESNRGVIIIPL